MHVAIVTDDPGWHGARLREAFAARGVTGAFSSLSTAVLRLQDVPPVVLGGFTDRLPDAVFVRGVPGGTLEQTVFQLNALHALQDLGVPVYNDGRAIERSVDKAYTTLRLHHAGIATPPTWVTADPDVAREIVRRETARRDVRLCKPLFGSQGQGIAVVAAACDLPDVAEVNGVWYLQRFVGERSDTATDWRVMVVGGRAIAAMRRSAPGWRANVAQGGQCQAALPEGECARLAEAAAGCLDMAYAGVDLMRDRDGSWWVIEVNSIPAWRGLQSVCQIDIAASLVDDLLRRCGTSRLDEVVS